MSENQKPKGYKFKVDKEKHSSEDRYISGLKVLEFAGIFDVTKFGLYQKIKGQSMERITQLEDLIDLAEKGIERFVTLPLEQQEGETLLRVDCLPEEDRQYLKSTGWTWEVHSDGGVNWLVIYGYPVPEGYNFKTTDVSLRLECNYPEAQIDMAYFGNHLALEGGGQIGALTDSSHLNRVWQRWSRHRTQQNPWRIGVDCVETHMTLVHHWLEKELNGGSV